LEMSEEVPKVFAGEVLVALHEIPWRRPGAT
jgi:hypothetical protein